MSAYIPGEDKKDDIAAYFPVAFPSTLGMGIRWWIPVKKKENLK